MLFDMSLETQQLSEECAFLSCLRQHCTSSFTTWALSCLSVSLNLMIASILRSLCPLHVSQNVSCELSLLLNIAVNRNITVDLQCTSSYSLTSLQAEFCRVHHVSLSHQCQSISLSSKRLQKDFDSRVHEVFNDINFDRLSAFVKPPQTLSFVKQLHN